jgi:UDP-glucose 4-epimerase
MTPADGPILVTGGAGYIGSHCVLALRDAEREVVVVDDLSTGYAELVPPGVPLVVGDIADRVLMADVFARHRPSAVIHFAGSIVNEESIYQPLKYYRNNTGASLSLVESCAAADVRFLLFSSSAAVYGSARTIPIPEESPAAPVTPYGMSKWMTEQILSDVAASSSLRYAALRYFNVAGADSSGRSGPSAAHPTHLLRLACQAVVGTRDSVAIFGTDYDTPDGTCIRDYVHVSDLADAHVAALDRLLDSRANFTLNAGYGHGFSVREVLTKFKKLGRADLKICEEGRRAGDVAALVADNRRIVAELGWRPRYDDLDTIVTTALAWERRLADNPLN